MAPAALCVLALLGAAQASAATTSACQAARAPARAFVVRVPFDVVDGRIYLQATVNGRGPFRFALDTGASGMGRADRSLVTTLGLTPEAPTLNSDGVRTTEADTTRLDSLTVGGLTRRDLSVITKDYNSKMAAESAFYGIVAREFFADGLLVIDYPRKTLSYSTSLSLSPMQEGTLRYERPFRVPVTIGGVKTEGNLDTGANVAFVLPQPLYEQVASGPAVDAGAGQLSNSKVETRRATVPGPFTIGAVSLSDQEVRVSDRYPELLVGAHALQHFTMLIDQRSKTVALCR